MEIVKCCKTLAIFCKNKHKIIYLKYHFIFPPGRIITTKPNSLYGETSFIGVKKQQQKIKTSLSNTS